MVLGVIYGCGIFLTLSGRNIVNPYGFDVRCLLKFNPFPQGADGIVADLDAKLLQHPACTLIAHENRHAHNQVVQVVCALLVPVSEWKELIESADITFFVFAIVLVSPDVQVSRNASKRHFLQGPLVCCMDRPTRCSAARAFTRVRLRLQVEVELIIYDLPVIKKVVVPPEERPILCFFVLRQSPRLSFQHPVSRCYITIIISHLSTQCLERAPAESSITLYALCAISPSRHLQPHP